MPNDMSNAPLRLAGGKSGGTPSEAANTLQSNQIIRLVDVLGEGPISAVRQVYFNETPYNETTLSDTAATPNFEGVEISTRLGLPDQQSLTGYTSQEADTIVDAAVTNGTPIVRTITEPLTDAARVIIKLPALFHYDDEGNMNAASVTYQIQYRPNGGNWTDIPDSPVKIIDEKNTSPVFLSHRFDLTGSAPWDIRVVRVTSDGTDNTRLQNATYFYSLAEIIEQKFSYRNTAYLGIKADAQLFGDRIPSRAALVDGLICEVPTNFDPVTRTYSGVWNGTFKEAWTDCPAWCLRDLIVKTRYGLGHYINSSFLDNTTLYQISQYCAEHVDDGAGGTEPRFTFNAYIGSRQEAYDLINAIASVFRGMVYWSLGLVMFTQDAPKTATLSVTRANTVNGEFNYQGASLLAIHNRINVTYNDPANFYKKDIVTVDDPDHIVRFGVRPTDIVAFGCTSKAQAIRAGRWLMYTERMESDVLSYVGGPDHVDVVPGDIVRVMDPSVSGVENGGRLAGYGTTTVTLDRDVVIATGESYELVVHGADRTLSYRGVLNAPGTTNTLTLDAALPALTANPKETVWALHRTSGPDTLYRVLSSREIGPHQYEVVAVSYDESKFSVIEGGYEIPSYPLPLLPTGPLPVPQNFRAVEQASSQSGTSNALSVMVSVTRSPDPRVRGVELLYRRKGQEWQHVDMRGNLTHTLNNVLADRQYQFKVRSYDGIGNYSAWSATLNVTPASNPTGVATFPNVTSTVVVGGFQTFSLAWVNPVRDDFKEVQIYAANTNNINSAQLIGTTPAQRFSFDVQGNAVTKYFFIRTVYHATPLAYSSILSMGGATTLRIQTQDVAPGAIDPTRISQSLTDQIAAASQSAASDKAAAEAAALAAATARNAAQDAQALAEAAQALAADSAAVSTQERIASESAASSASVSATNAAASVMNVTGSAQNAAEAQAAAAVSEVLAARSQVAASTGNLVRTINADTGVGGWQYTAVSTAVPSGSPTSARSLRMSDGAAELPRYTGNANGRVFRVTAWVNTTGTTGVSRFSIRGTLAGATPPQNTNIAIAAANMPAGTGWTQYTTTITVAQDTIEFAPAIDLANTGQTVDVYDLRFDDITQEHAAQNYALAANTSAAQASTSASAAGASASAASASANTATTRAGEATSAATSAANSANTASTAAVSATSAQTVSARLASDALSHAAGNLVGDPYFQRATLDYWSVGLNGALTRENPSTVLTVSDYAMRVDTPSTSTTVTCYYAGPNSRFEIAGKRIRFEAMLHPEAAGAVVRFGARLCEADGTYVQTVYIATPTIPTGTWTRMSVDVDFPVPTNGRYYNRLVANPVVAANGQYVEITDLIIRDVTGETAAEDAASASASSALAAQASQTAAGTFASSAATSSTNAGTSAAQAATSASQASGYANTAEGHSLTAQQSSQTAARFLSRGAAANPSFSEWANPASFPDAWTGNVTQGAINRNNLAAKYTYCAELATIATPTAQYPALHLNCNTSPNVRIVPGAATRVMVSLEVSLGAGDWDGFTIAVEWRGATTVTARKTLDQGELTTDINIVQKLDLFFDRPAGYVSGGNAASNYIVLTAYATSTYGNGLSYKVVRIHSFDIQDVRAESLTNIVQESRIGITGIQTAAIALRAKAGTAGAELELVALDDPAGNPESAARISADNIILDGTVSLEALRVGLGGNLLHNTEFAMGAGINWKSNSGQSPAFVETSWSIRPPGSTYAGATFPVGHLYQSGTSAGGYRDVVSVKTDISGAHDNRHVPCIPGERFIASAYLAALNCNGIIYVLFRDINGTSLGAVSTQVNAYNPSANNPDAWTRATVAGTAPANAAFAQVYFRKTGTIAPAANSSLFIHKPMLERGPLATTTEASPYRPGGTVTINGGALLAQSISASRIAAGTLTANEIIANGITRQGVAGSGLVTNNSATWTTVTTFTLTGMPVASYLQGACGFALNTAPTALPSTFGIQVLVNGVSRMTLTQGSASFAGSDQLYHYRPFTDNLVAGGITVTLRIQNFGGFGIQSSNVSAIAAMR